MNILHILWTFEVGGIQTMLVDIVNKQVEQNKITIIVVNNQVDGGLKNKLDKRINLICCKRKVGSVNPFPIISLNYYIWRIRPDVIHCHEDRITNVFWTKTPMIRTVHNVASSPNEYPKFQKLCCISSAVYEYTKRQGYENCVIVNNGICVGSIKKRDNVFSSNKEIIKAVCIGRLNKSKGQIFIVEALNILVNQRNIKKVVVDLIGDYHGDKEYKSLFETKIKEYHLSQSVHLLGEKSRDFCFEHLADYDFFIMPSTSEGFGLSLAEACSAKIPVITSDLPATMEIIDGGRNGMFFKTENAESLADEIGTLISKGVDVERVERAFHFVKENFDVVNTANKYLEIYYSLIRK